LKTTIVERERAIVEGDGYIRAKKFQLTLIQHHLNDTLVFFQFLHEYNNNTIWKKTKKKKNSNNNGVRTRRKQGVVRYKDPLTLEIKVLPPTMSLWYHYYCNGLEHGLELMPSFHEKFRRRFRLPYSSYLELLALCNSEASSGGYMKRWKDGATAANKKPAAPLCLLLLCALR
jgi:hypothetical protein